MQQLLEMTYSESMTKINVIAWLKANPTLKTLP